MTELPVALTIIFLLVIANGLFVAAEFAIVGASRASIEHEAAQGNRLARRVARILEDPGRHFGRQSRVGYVRGAHTG